jgi:large subunit ribosomal protein L15
VPKRGFINEFKKKIEIVNLSALDSFEANSTITPEMLREKRIIRKLGDGVKILGEGELLKPLIVQANYFSRKAQEKIEKAGGKVEVL